MKASHLYGLANGHFRDGIDGMSDMSIGTTLEDENALLQVGIWSVVRVVSLVCGGFPSRKKLGD